VKNKLKMICLAFTLCCTFMQIANGAQPNNTTLEIVNFFNVAGALEQKMQAQLLQFRENHQTAEEKMFEQTLTYFNKDAFSARYATVFDKYLDADDIHAFKRFMVTPSGIKLANLLKNSDPQLSTSIDTLDLNDKKSVTEFFRSPVGVKTRQALDSPESHQVWPQYFEDIMCMNASKNDVATLNALKSQGKCRSIR